jgi:hypothetical protein
MKYLILMVSSATMLAGGAMAQPSLEETAPYNATVSSHLTSGASPNTVVAPTQQQIPQSITIPEGTRIAVVIDEELSSAKSVAGDKFNFHTTEPITIGGLTIPANLTGAGEVSYAKRKGMMGVAGELNIKFNYVRYKNLRIPVRGSSGGNGANSTGATVALTVLFGPVGMLKHGHDMEIHGGQTATVYTDADAIVPAQ